MNNTINNTINNINISNSNMEQTNNKVKVNVNDKCYCGSNKKYKKCCLLADQAKQIEENIYEQSEELTTAINILKQHFPEIEFKNVTTKLNTQTYRPMQINHFKDNVCQVAERIKTNDRVFKDRDNSEDGDYDLLLMYRGAYRILYMEQMYLYIHYH